MSRIKILDEHCINQIAAGEVVERPLSIVKELIENSLDAAARKVEISVEGGGTSLIRIKDDGFGILPDDLRLAVLPHATSKISTLVDLASLETLGFRGEALPSIASVSRLSILSRPAGQLSGHQIDIEGGSFLAFAEKGCPPGTTVTVRDLFYNTPARQKFLRSNNTEFGLISDMVSRLALARPEVSFTLRHPANLVFNTPGQGNLLETIAAVMGSDTARSMLPVRSEGDNFQLEGYISPPSLVRSSLNGVTFLVNGRVIRSQLLNQALKEGYYTLIPAGTHPLAVLSLTMSPADYDVNVHPAKLEIKFKEEKILKDRIARIIREALLAHTPVKSISLAGKADPHAGRKDGTSSAKGWDQLKILYEPLKTPLKESPSPYAGVLNSSPINNSQGLINTDELQVLKLNGKRADQQEKLAEPEAALRFEELRALSQVFNTYILSTDGQSLYVIDQHAAHERIRYDKLIKQLPADQISSQLLLIPETVDLTLREESILIEYFDKLHDMGFIIEHFGDRTYFLRGVPLPASLENPGKIFRMFLDEVLEGIFQPSREKLLEEWIFMLACRSAIKGRERLSIQEMDELIQQLGKTDNPYTCPHGRPTIIEIPKAELEKRFNR